MASQANAALPDGYELEGYRIVKKISSGGFSIVYLARDEFDRPVAIKEYLPSSLALRRPVNWHQPSQTRICRLFASV